MCDTIKEWYSLSIILVQRAFTFSVVRWMGIGQVKILRYYETYRIQERRRCCCTIIRTWGLSIPFQKIMITTDTHANRLYITHFLQICWYTVVRVEYLLNHPSLVEIAKFQVREIIRFYSIKEIKNTFRQFHHADELKVRDKDKWFIWDILEIRQ